MEGEEVREQWAMQEPLPLRRAPGGRSGLLSDTESPVPRHSIIGLSNSDTPKSQHNELRKGLSTGEDWSLL